MTNRNQPRPHEDNDHRLVWHSPSPEMPPAEVLREHCEDHNLQFVHIIGSRVCACPNGCLYSYPKLEKLIGV